MRFRKDRFFYTSKADLTKTEHTIQPVIAEDLLAFAGLRKEQKEQLKQPYVCKYVHSPRLQQVTTSDYKRYSIGTLVHLKQRNQSTLEGITEFEVVSDKSPVILDAKGKVINSFDDVSPSDIYESLKRKTCFLGQVISNIIREVRDCDYYYTEDDTTQKIQGWSFLDHAYDRLFDGHAFKLSHSKFFFQPYELDRQPLCGFSIGLLANGAIASLLAVTILGLCSPWVIVGFCLIPSLILTVKALHSVGRACALLIKPNTPERNLAIKMNLQRALSTFLIALAMPFVWIASFTLELVRFLTRTGATIVHHVQACIKDIMKDEEKIKDKEKVPRDDSARGLNTITF